MKVDILFLYTHSCRPPKYVKHSFKNIYILTLTTHSNLIVTHVCLVSSSLQALAYSTYKIGVQLGRINRIGPKDIIWLLHTQGDLSLFYVMQNIAGYNSGLSWQIYSPRSNVTANSYDLDTLICAIRPPHTNISTFHTILNICCHIIVFFDCGHYEDK